MNKINIFAKILIIIIGISIITMVFGKVSNEQDKMIIGSMLFISSITLIIVQKKVLVHIIRYFREVINESKK